jgi:hypothetical protein
MFHSPRRGVCALPYIIAARFNEAGGRVRHLYFPSSGIVSLLSVIADGGGVVGIAMFMCWLAHRPPGQRERSLGMKPSFDFDKAAMDRFSSEGAPSRQDPLPTCVITPGTMSGFHPRRMPSLPVACRKRRRAATLSKTPLACFQGAVAMTPQEDIAAMQDRIVKAESRRDSWRASGIQEKYLEAYSMVEALEVQLAQLQQAARMARP